MILLVAVGVLVIFALATVMFVISARQHRITSQAQQRVERYDDNFEELLQRALMQVLRGSNNPASSVATHSLLEDMYGNDSLPPLRDALNPPNPDDPSVDPDPVRVQQRWVIEVDVNGARSPSGLILIEIQDSRLNQQDGYYNGRLLTVLDGPARMQSSRIVGYDYNTTSSVGHFQVKAFDNSVLPRPGNRVVINGREFNGTGFGYYYNFTNPSDPDNGTTRTLDRDPATSGLPNDARRLALYPNAAAFYRFPNPIAGNPPPPHPYPDHAGLGGADEGYDAPDYNNLALAGRFWNPDPPDPNNDPNDGRWEVLIPSYHRPALINYMRAQGVQPNSVAAQRKFILRPLLADPNNQLAEIGQGAHLFDGDNPLLSQSLRTMTPDNNNDGVPDILWDVDNDGDGLVDSIWVDFGLPVRTSADGRQYKPLFAVMVQDLDSRLNLNAHGSPVQIVMNGPHQVYSNSVSEVNQPQAQIRWRFAGGNAEPNSYLPPGQGNSPRAVNLRTILSDVELAQLLYGVPENRTETPEYGSFGEYNPNIFTDPTAPPPYPGRTDGLQDPQDRINNPDFPFRDDNNPPNWHGGWAPGMVGSGAPANPSGEIVGFPVDLAEASLMGLDKHGSPLRLLMGDSNTPMYPQPLNQSLRYVQRNHGLQFNPYGDRYRVISPSVTEALDSPLQIGDLEELLRLHDIDARSLHRRLRRLLPNYFATSGGNAARELRRLRQGLVTTDSFDPPVFRAVPTAEMRSEMERVGFHPTGNHILDLMVFKILYAHRTANPPRPQPSLNTITAWLPRLLSPELALGVRMNVNRPVGNYRDDDNNGVVDDPGELWDITQHDANNDGRPQGNEMQPESVWWRNAAEFNALYGPAYGGSELTQLQARYQNFIGVPMDHDNDGQNLPAHLLARQGYARHLYVLLMLMMDPAYRVPVDPQETMTPAERQRHTAQRIAQWAVNAIDFRDPDSIMTMFEVDLEPFVDNDNNPNNGTWDVDGDPTTNESNAFRAVLFGCERPQLLLTEAAAFHDFRAEDRDDEEPDPDTDQAARIGMGQNDDQDLDQRVVPQGSAYLELYNIWREPVPRELSAGTNQNVVDLGRLAPALPGDTPRPVWQVVIREGPAPIRQPDQPDTGHLDPTYPRLTQMDYANDQYRVVWFTDSAPNVSPHIYHVAAGATKTLARGKYALIGPETAELIDPSNDPTTAARTTFDLRNASPVSNSTSVTYPTLDDQIQRPTRIVVKTPHRLSVSEPHPSASYYSLPQDANGNNLVKDIPLDSKRFRVAGSFEGSYSVYLQRLANPLAPWHAERNPYLTVDYCPMDLTIFNSHRQAQDGGMDDPSPTPASADANGWDFNAGGANQNALDYKDANFTTTERIGDNDDINVWKQSFSDPYDENKVRPSELAHSLGFVSGYRPGGGSKFLASGSGGGVWTSADSMDADFQRYIGDPKPVPYPWFMWNNHPFRSHLELMNVPASSPSRLLLEHHIRSGPPGQEQFYDHYGDRSPGASEHGPNAGPPFDHLLNFFYSSDPANDQWNTPNARSNFYRALEFLQVPSRYDGAEEILSPAAFFGDQLRISGNAVGHTFHPPFNRLSRFRDPGRININTIFDDGTTWAAILNNDYRGITGTNTNRNKDHWRKVFFSRQGYGGASLLNPSRPPVLPTLDNTLPTFFANPFRPFTDAYNVPIDALRGIEYVEATLLRRDPTDPTRTRPLLVPRSDIDDQIKMTMAGNTDPDALGAGDGRTTGGFAHRDADRNSGFRYDPLAKLGNILTTRSNVYAIWITVGYFEVAPAPRLPRTANPDGYVLGKELGSDTGEAVRHRLFAVFDRSRPVAFIRGEDFNVSHAIIAKKIIE